MLLVHDMEIHDGDEVLCFDQQHRSLVATTALGLMGFQLPQVTAFRVSPFRSGFLEF